jgi:serine/threonine protein kinase
MNASSEPHLRDNRYVLRGLLGEGSQGTTFDAVDLREGRPVAIKRFDVRGARSWKDVELAEREARVLASLDHPLLPKYVEHFEEGGALYLVMEKIEGETLDAMRLRKGGVSEEETFGFLDCAAAALGYLSSRTPAVVHRDIKPRNVVRRPDGTYVLVDFGAVAERMKPGGGSTVVGTIGFMAPEQLQGRAMPATDVYAVGATALAALTGTEPETLPHRGLRVDVRRALAGRVREPLVRALEQMLEPDPDLRPSSLEPLLTELRGGPSRRRVRREEPQTKSESVAEEDRQVRSLRSLSWTLWALGWPTVMPITRQPAIMFIWLALTLIVNWHRGAVFRAILREFGRARDHRVREAAEQSAEKHRVSNVDSNSERASAARIVDSESPSEQGTDVDDAERSRARSGRL